MPLDMTMLYSAATIFGKRRDDVGNVGYGPLGTGFVLLVPSEFDPNRSYPYMITAHHVINEAWDTEVVMANPYKGEPYPSQPVPEWKPPLDGVDLAVAPFPVPEGQTPIGLTIGREVAEGLQLAIGADFHYVGLLAGLNIPMARSGTIGAIDVVGMHHDGPYDYPAHLADVRSYGGFSGSPCYVEYPLPNLTPLDLKTLGVPLPSNMDPKTPRGSMAYLHLLFGMFVEHHTDPSSAGGAVSHLGIGVILPVDLIIKGLMSEGLREQRRAWDEQAEANKPVPPVQGALVGSAESEEFDRFEDLTDRLLRVPKAELDEKLREG